MSLFREIMVWKRLDAKSAMRYSCLQNILTGLYTVQSADFFYLPLDRKLVREHDEQFVELFVEFSADKKKGWFGSLIEAISQHDYFFSDEYDEAEDTNDSGDIAG